MTTKTAYQIALAEGRIVRYGIRQEHARSFKEFASTTDAAKFAAELNDEDVEAVVLKVEAA